MNLSRCPVEGRFPFTYSILFYSLPSFSFSQAGCLCSQQPFIAGLPVPTETPVFASLFLIFDQFMYYFSNFLSNFLSTAVQHNLPLRRVNRCVDHRQSRSGRDFCTPLRTSATIFLDTHYSLPNICEHIPVPNSLLSGPSTEQVEGLSSKRGMATPCSNKVKMWQNAHIICRNG
jgi:hypothetical protein